MRGRSDPADRGMHRKIAGYLFNHTWYLLDKKRRTQAENDEMLHAAHASRYHWGRVGRPLNLSIGEWQVSRVYSVLGRPEPAIFHARRALEIAHLNGLGRFYVAYAYEALARAFAIARKPHDRDKYIRLAQRTSEGIRDVDDRRMLEEDLATVR